MGRAEKYANVVDKFKEEEKEEKLSVTREMKFEDLQKEIDNSVTIADMEEMNGIVEPKKKKPVAKSIVKEEDVVVPKEQPKKTVRKKKEDTKEVKIIDEPTAELIAVDGEESDLDEDDLFLTQSMEVIGKKKFRLKKIVKIIISLLILTVLGLLAYFKVIRPIYLNIVNAEPRKVFENSIDFLVDKSTGFIEEYMDDSNGILYLDTNLKIDSNMEDFDELGNVYYGFKFGVDTNNKEYFNSIYLKNGSDLFEYQYIENGGTAYRKLSTYDKYMILGPVEDKEEDASYYSELAELLKTEKKDDLIYFIKKYAEYTKASFTDEMFSKKNEEIEINSKKIRVKCNKLILDKSVDEKTDEKAKKLAEDDERFKELYSKYIDDWDSEGSLDETIIINIYTKGFNNRFIGFDIIEDGFRVAYYYKDGNDFIAHFNLTEDEDCIKGKDCVASNQEIYDFKGVEKDNGTEVTIEYNGREVAILLVRNISSEKIDLDYDIVADGEHYKGDLLLLTNNADNVIEYSVSYREKDNKYFNVKGTFKYNIMNALPVIREEDTIELSAKQEDEIFDEFLDSFGSDNIKDKYLIWYEVMTEPFSLFEEENSSTA